MENLTQHQAENVLSKVNDLLNYLVKEDILYEFDPSLTSRLVGCQERLKILISKKTNEQPTKHIPRLERYIKSELEAILSDLKGC